MFDSDSSIMLETLRKMLGNGSAESLSGPELERAFRAAHSIKSEAGFLNLTDVADAAHGLEDVLAQVRQAAGGVNHETAARLRHGVRTLEEALTAYRRARHGTADGAGGVGAQPDDGGGPAAASAGRAGESAGHTTLRTAAAERGMLREARQRGERLFRLTVALKTVPELRYARAFLVVNNLELSSSVVQSRPRLEELAQSTGDTVNLLVTTDHDEEAVRRAVHVDEVELLEVNELSYDELPADVEGTGARPAEGVAGEGPQISVPAESQAEISLLADEILAAAEDVREGFLAGGEEQGRERVTRIARLANALRERVGGTACVQLLELLRELKERPVRYAARQGKRVRVVVGGQGALVPTVVGDTILETLMHLVRNSIDHGIETIDARAKCGRHPAATIKLRVDRTGGRVRVIVQDDGTGVDEDAVRERAGDYSSPLLDVLARSGFSMRETPDTGSGRGVGLDNVVHSIRTLLRGDIKLVNNPDKGMTFVISVPASTRLIHVLVVESGDAAYAIPSATVVAHQVLDRSRLKRDSFGSLFYDFRGDMLAVSTIAGRSPALKNIRDGSVGIVARFGSERRLIVADSILAEEPVVREDARVKQVYSRTLGREVGFVFPLA